MFKLIDVKIKVVNNRLGKCTVEYHGLIIKCELVLYKYEKMWIRMPERWQNKKKMIYVGWADKKTSDLFQFSVLAQIQQKTKMTLQSAIEMKKQYFKDRKKNDKNKKFK